MCHPNYKLFETGRLRFLQLCTLGNHTSPTVVIHTDKLLILHNPCLFFKFYYTCFSVHFQKEDNRNDGTFLESGCVYIIKISDL